MRFGSMHLNMYINIIFVYLQNIGVSFRRSRHDSECHLVDFVFTGGKSRVPGPMSGGD